MDRLVDTIQKVLVTGQITDQQATQINQLLWKTPMDQPVLKALSRLEKELSTGNVTASHHM
ncbi:MAG: hypothetical protein HC799_06170 [Limnothrix sp. RL_2_0]|nr:hypothetical protein [Limnothrix sp. RL_2_0]